MARDSWSIVLDRYYGVRLLEMQLDLHLSRTRRILDRIVHQIPNQHLNVDLVRKHFARLKL